METFGSYVTRCREWQKINPEWELICDIKNLNTLYIQWSELGRDERMSGVGRYRTDAKKAFEEFGLKKCKVEKKVLDNNLNLCKDWPHGHAMTVYRTSVDGVRVI